MSRSAVWLKISISLSLLLLGVLAVISGVVLYFAPSGKGSGVVIVVGPSRTATLRPGGS